MRETKDHVVTAIEPKAKTETRVRRPWHAPQFIQTEVALTDMQGGGETDPTGFPS
jgi:hypothetical protein